MRPYRIDYETLEDYAIALDEYIDNLKGKRKVIVCVGDDSSKFNLVNTETIRIINQMPRDPIVIGPQKRKGNKWEAQYKYHK